MQLYGVLFILIPVTVIDGKMYLRGPPYSLSYLKSEVYRVKREDTTVPWGGLVLQTTGSDQATNL